MNPETVAERRQARRLAGAAAEPTPRQRAVALLTRREHSRIELERKLTQRGVAANVAQATVERLAAEGWQSDARFAQSLLRARAGAGYGPAYVRAELANWHGLSAERITAAMDGFDGDWDELARALVQRRHPAVVAGRATVAEQRKAVDSLLRRGFSLEQARVALRPA